MAQQGSFPHSAARAGVQYFAIAFAAGFALGTLRVLLLVPEFGETTAVLIELPIMLAIAWISARWLIERHGISPAFSARAAMGAVAFTLLMVAEFLLGWLAFGRPLPDQVSALGTLPGALGLTGQIAFGLIPLFIGSARA